MLMMLGAVVDGQGAEQLTLMMRGALVARVKGKTADAGDARCLCGTW